MCASGDAMLRFSPSFDIVRNDTRNLRETGLPPGTVSTQAYVKSDDPLVVNSTQVIVTGLEPTQLILLIAGCVGMAILALALVAYCTIRKREADDDDVDRGSEALVRDRAQDVLPRVQAPVKEEVSA